ncbi:hypothetical protein AX16_004124 [Volvariella volvacea WC 439]|nr:hypothetical protein AX16_004124 [Volvariella volvacea WC 439]
MASSNSSAPQASRFASVQPIPGGPPMLHPGDLNPAVLRDYECACLDFFSFARVPGEDQVRCIFYTIHDPVIRRWIDLERISILKMSFEQFMAHLRNELLPPTWMDDISIQLLGSRMKSSDSFLTWAYSLWNLNSYLVNTPAFLDDNRLRRQIEANMDPDLLSELEVHDVNKNCKLPDWICAVNVIDNHLKNKRMQLQDSNIKRDRGSPSIPACEPSYPPTPPASSPARASTPSNYSFSPLSTSTTHPGGLTSSFRVRPYNPERTPLLQNNSGCVKCRSHAAGRRTLDHPNELPVPVASNYIWCLSCDQVYVDVEEQFKYPTYEQAFISDIN